MRYLSAHGLKLIERFEGCKLHVYNDVAGYATIGYGHLLHKSPFTAADKQTITQEEADELLLHDVQIHVDAVNERVIVPITQNQFDALVSLSFNIGTHGMGGSSLVKAINAGRANHSAEMVALFAMWDKARGVENKGLLARRHTEASVFNTPDGPTEPRVTSA